MKVTNHNPGTEHIHGGHVHSAQSGIKVSKPEQEGKGREAGASQGAESAARPEISAKARELATAKEAASKAPDIREEKIAKLKEMIAAGKYKVDAHAVADRMVDEHLSSGIG